MKHIKSYEKYNPPTPTDPKIGDYVITIDIPNLIGKITDDISSTLATFRTYIVKYPLYKISNDLKKYHFNGNKITVWDSEIIKFSNNKKDLESYISAEKFNL